MKTLPCILVDRARKMKELLEGHEETERTLLAVRGASSLVKEGRAVVNILTGVVAISRDVYLYFDKPVDGDETKALRGLCRMFREYINFQRSWKQGDLKRMIEAGDYDRVIEDDERLSSLLSEYESFANSRLEPLKMPQDMMIRRSVLSSMVTARYSLMEDCEPLRMLVVNPEGKLLLAMTDLANLNKLDFSIFD